MCIIVDTNVLGPVFNIYNKDHEEFSPILSWIFKGNGKIVFGGTRYTEEIGKYLPLFVELKKINKAIHVNACLVDEKEQMVHEMIKDKNFNDQHLVSLLITSGCKLICSADKSAYPFFTHKDFFNSAKTKPRIYSGKKNKELLTNKYVAKICMPSTKTTNTQREILNKLISNQK